jgi:hypothetical protein
LSKEELVPFAEHRSGELIFVDDAQLKSELTLSEFRYAAFEALKEGRQPEFACPGCREHLYPRLSRHRRPHWAHIASTDRYSRPECPFGRESRLTINQLDSLIYRGRQEGETHKNIVRQVIGMLELDPRVSKASIKAGVYVPPSIAALTYRGRFPDVFFSTEDRKYAIEVQISPITLHRLSERVAFYRSNDINLIWLTNHFEPESYRKTWLWDVIAAQKGLAFSLDDETLASARNRSRFLLRQHTVRPDSVSAAIIDALDLDPPIPWHERYKAKWVKSAGTHWMEATPLVDELTPRLPLPLQQFDRYSVARALNVLITIERWQTVGSSAANPISVVHGLLDSSDGPLAYSLVEGALREYQPIALEKGKTASLIERARAKARSKGMQPWGRNGVVGRLRDLLFPEWKLGDPVHR